MQLKSALCEGAVVKMAAKVWATTVGPHSRICWGEWGKQSYSNKGHDGFCKPVLGRV
jgi:hypothetical protein